MVGALRTIRVRSHPFIRSIRIVKPTIQAGEDQVIRFSLHNPLQEVVVLSATIVYPGGDLENIATGTMTSKAEILWRVPAWARMGSAQVALTAGSGGCCGGDVRKQGFGTVSPIITSFEIV